MLTGGGDQNSGDLDLVSVVGGDCGDCGDSLTVPPPPRVAPDDGLAIASGSSMVRVLQVKLGQERGILHIVPGHPGYFLQPVSLPVNKIFQATTPSLRVQYVLHPVA